METRWNVVGGMRLAIIFAVVVGMVPSVFAFESVVETASDSEVLVSRINEAMGLRSSKVSRVVYPEGEPGMFRLDVELGGRMRAVTLKRRSLLSDKYRLLVDHGTGDLVEVTSQAPATYRGYVGDGQGVAAITLTSKGLRGFVGTGSETWYVQPLADVVDGADRDLVFVYRNEDVIDGDVRCGVEGYDSLRDHLQDSESPVGPSAAGGASAIQIAEIAFDADFENFSFLGSVAAVEEDVFDIMNVVESQYDSQLGIRYEITSIVVRDSVNDPYGTTTNASTLLNNFQNVWTSPPENSIPRDLAHLRTSQLPVGGPGPTVQGLAILGSVCSNISGYGLTNTRSLNNEAARVDVVAHEIGHNWDAPHCDEGPGAGLPFPGCCGNPFYTMCSVSFGGFGVRNEFCPPVVTIIEDFKATRFCLENAPPDAALPIFDEFVSAQLNEDIWVGDGVTVDTSGSGEPSPPRSLRINAGDSLTSGIFDTSDACGVTLEYWWQRTGSLGLGGSPELNEDLLFEYRNVDGEWLSAPGAQHPGIGSDNDPYEFNSVTLPSDAEHQGFQIRLHILGNPNFSDNFFVDDLRIFAAAELIEIAEQPDDSFACPGGSGQFTVVPTGDPPFTFQWKKDGVAIPGAESQTLEITNVQPDDFGMYSCEVGNVCSTIETIEAAMVETTPPVVSTQPNGATLPLGGTYFEFVAASGAPTFQWFKDNVALAGETAFFLQVENVGCEDAGMYRCDFTNDCDTVSSGSVELIVDDESCLNDTSPPRILQLLGEDGQTRPYTGYIDPRGESTGGGEFDLGVTRVLMVFSEFVRNIENGGGLTIDSFSVSETGGGAPPSVIDVDDSQMPFVFITLDRPITPQEWTTIRADVEDQAGNQIENAGDLGEEDEGDRVDIGFLPCDVDQSGVVSPIDLFVFRQLINGVVTPQIGLVNDFIDTDRNNTVSPLDLFLYRQLISGSGPATQAWAGAEMKNERP